jgi:hypothetical protein
VASTGSGDDDAVAVDAGCGAGAATGLETGGAGVVTFGVGGDHPPRRNAGTAGARGRSLTFAVKTSGADGRIGSESTRAAWAEAVTGDGVRTIGAVAPAAAFDVGSSSRVPRRTPAATRAPERTIPHAMNSERCAAADRPDDAPVFGVTEATTGKTETRDGCGVGRFAEVAAGHAVVADGGGHCDGA